MEVARSKKISDARNQFEDLIQMAKNSEPAIDFLCSSLSKLLEPLQKIVPNATISKQDEFETFIGGKIPDEVQIHSPTDIMSKGRSKRIKKRKETLQEMRASPIALLAKTPTLLAKAFPTGSPSSCWERTVGVLSDGKDLFANRNVGPVGKASPTATCTVGEGGTASTRLPLPSPTGK
jgi:hypothetical protein